jgi:RNA polymerase-interacting CarD/CdnL/TRCF family regulator
MDKRLKELAEQAGIENTLGCFWQSGDTNLERFADLVRQDERDKKPEWQELYKDEIKEILNDGEEWSSLEFAQAVSDLLREKNT